MIGVIKGIVLHMDVNNPLRYIIGWNDIGSPGTVERQNRELCQPYECTDHIELGGLRKPTVPQNDRRAKDPYIHVREKLMYHMFTKLLGPGIGVIIIQWIRVQYSH